MAEETGQDDAPADHEEIRYFTPEEAQAALPSVVEKFLEIRKLVEKATELQELRKDMWEYWGRVVQDPTNPENARFNELGVESQSIVRRINQRITEITSLGAHVKDVESGLVDFYAKRGDEIVLLCWRDGEPAIGWWHDLVSGVRGRKPLSEF